MKANLFITIAGLIVFPSWTRKQEEDIKKAEWLIGTWENHTAKGNIYETWEKKNANEFSGKSYMIKENDTVVFENIRLMQRSGQLLYIPAVKDQNNGLPVYFTAKKISDNTLVFENPEHDFPQVISYTRITPDSLVAEVSGTKNGRNRSQIFPMKKVK